MAIILRAILFLIEDNIHESRVDQSRDCNCLSTCNDIYFDATTNKMTIYFQNYSMIDEL